MSALIVTTSYAFTHVCQSWHCTPGYCGKLYLHRCHEFGDLLVVEFKDAIEDADLIVAERLLALAVELEEGPKQAC